MKTKYTLLAILFAAVLGIGIVGCNSGTTTTPTDPAKVANIIQIGTTDAVALGLVAVPDAAEATQIATLAEQVLDQNVLPVLNGDNAGLVSGLGDILALNAFNDPKLSKVKLVLEAAMPILEAYLPPDVAHAGSIPPDVKAYLLSFFTGARQGISNYLGGKAMAKGLAERDFASYQDLRAKLSAPVAKAVKAVK